MVCLRTNWAGTGCSDVSRYVVALPKRLMRVSYQDLSHLHALLSMLSRHRMVLLEGPAGSYWLLHLWTRRCPCEFGFKPFCHEMHLFPAS